MAEISRQAFELSRSGDPVAGSTGWTQLTGNGRSYPIRASLRINVNRLEFRASMAAIMVLVLFLAAGLMMLALSALSPLVLGFRLPAGIFAVAWIVAAVTLFHYLAAPVVLDKSRGRVWHGRRSSLPLLRRFALPRAAALADVYAIQVLGKSRDGRSRDFCGYELNLVLKDGERLNVFEHPGETQLRSDARQLSVFLGKPVWDGVA